MDEVIVPKRKGGRPRKVQDQPVVAEPVKSEAKAWEDELQGGPVVVATAKVDSAPAKGQRDAIFKCGQGHKTRAMENELPECRICHGKTLIAVVYDEWQRKASKTTVREVLR